MIFNEEYYIILDRIDKALEAGETISWLKNSLKYKIETSNKEFSRLISRFAKNQKMSNWHNTSLALAEIELVNTRMYQELLDYIEEKTR